MTEELGVDKNKEEGFPGMYLDGEKVPWSEGDGPEKEGRGQVQVMFCLVVNKRT